jgi:hypothetical protein
MQNFNLYRYYEILEVQPGATKAEIKSAYRELCKIWHPDRFTGDESLQNRAQEKLKEINEAYDALKTYTAKTEKAKPESETAYNPFNTPKRDFNKKKDKDKPNWEKYSFDPPPPPPETGPLSNFPMLRSVLTGFVVLIIGLGLLIQLNILTPDSKNEAKSVENFAQEVPEMGELGLPDQAEGLSEDPAEPNLAAMGKQPVNSQEPSTVVSTPSPQNPEIQPLFPAASKPEYITLGSMVDEVIAVVGPPHSKTIGTPATYQLWHYGQSTLTISTINRRVAEWDNQDKNLPVFLSPGPHASKALYFDRGFHRDDVLRLQGTPSRIERIGKRDDEIWYYGKSYVRISSKDNRVMDWSHADHPLQIPPESLVSQRQ